MQPGNKSGAAGRRSTTKRTEGSACEQTQRREHRASQVESRFRVAAVHELETLCDIDLDASRLFDQVGLELTPADSVEFAAAERSRWMQCLKSGTVFVASDRLGTPVGFAALHVLDGEPYLEQLSVRMSAMRRGIGSALLSAAECVAAKTRSRTLWLTTYQHLPWNAPFYEKAGFVTVPVEECGTEILLELLFQRRLLPEPDERVAMRKLLSACN